MIGFYRSAQCKRKGLTLTEIAIVLGAMGLVSGAVWGVVSVVWDSYRFYKTKEQIVAVVNNVRTHYAPMGGFYADSTDKTTFIANGTDITSILNDDTRRLIPVEMRLNPKSDLSAINHALSQVAGGSFHALSVNNGRTLRLRLLGLKQPQCIKLLMEFPVLMPEMGVTRIAANALSTAIDVKNISSPSATVTLPMQLSTATMWCSVTAAIGNEVQFDFKVKN